MKGQYKKACEFLYISHEQFENKMLMTLLFTMASKTMNYLGINSTLKMTKPAERN